MFQTTNQLAIINPLSTTMNHRPSKKQHHMQFFIATCHVSTRSFLHPTLLLRVPLQVAVPSTAQWIRAQVSVEIAVLVTSATAGLGPDMVMVLGNQRRKGECK